MKSVYLLLDILIYELGAARPPGRRDLIRPAGRGEFLAVHPALRPEVLGPLHGVAPALAGRCTTLHIQISKPIHQLILIFKQASAKPFFKGMFSIVDESGQFYEYAINYPNFMDRLGKAEDELATTILSVFSNFVYVS